MKPNQAIEVIYPSEDGNDILLCGIDDIQHANYELSVALYEQHINENNLVKNVIGIGPDKQFFYTISSFKDNRSIFYESGIGYAYEKDGKCYFNRTLPLYSGKTRDSKNPLARNSKFIFHEDTINILYSSVPDHFAYLFFDNNCILSSAASLAPVPIQVQENSFLARVSDNDLSSVSFSDKAFSDIIAEALTKYTKQLSLKTSKLSANKLSVKHLQLEPSNDTNVKKGTFVYDEATDSIKFYNGEKWRTLKWADEE